METIHGRFLPDDSDPSADSQKRNRIPIAPTGETGSVGAGSVQNTPVFPTAKHAKTQRTAGQTGTRSRRSLGRDQGLPPEECTLGSHEPRHQPAPSQPAPSQPAQSQPDVAGRDGDSDGVGDVVSAYVAEQSRYVPLGELGRGGWGIVQRALDKQLHREVAVKRINSRGKLRPHEVEQFLHEARITSGLQHPGVVPVHELVEDSSGDTFYVMKLLEGETLRHHIRSVHAQHGTGKWGREDLLHAINPLLMRFIDICNAVAYAHRRGIIHRDLKPSNVMAGAFGETIVVDWGLARFIDDDENDGATTVQGPADPHPATSGLRSSAPEESEGSVVGTPTYMAPEQARGEVSSLGSHSDIYSLGVILYEIVAGHHPHQGLDVQAVLDRARQGQFTPLSMSQPRTPKALVAIVHTAMSSDPKRRYQDVESLAEDVRRFMIGESVSVYRESFVERGVRWCKRHRAIATTVIVAAAVLLAVSLVSAIVIRGAHQAERQARIEAHLAHREALDHLIDARETADTWLVDLSGALQFHPVMLPLRNDLLAQAREQYEALVKRPITPLGQIDLSHAVARDEIDTDALIWLENARCHLRLGDLHRLCNDESEASDHYSKAGEILDQLHHKASLGHAVTLVASPSRNGWSSREPSLDDLVRLERINVAIGQVLASGDPPAFADAVRFRELLDRWVPVAPSEEDSANALSEFCGRAISTRIRLELVIGRSVSIGQGTQASVFSADRYLAAVRWALWLAKRRGSPSDLKLCETLLTENAERLSGTSDSQVSYQAWTDLIDELSRRLEETPDRSDWIASLAHARLRRAETSTQLDDFGQATEDYLAAIEDLKESWSLVDSDEFYRVNLATAQLNLGQLWSDGDEQQRGKASQLFGDAIATYQNLLQESATPDILRRLAEAHWAVADVAFADEANPDAVDRERMRHHVHSALLAYEILQDQNLLTDSDRLRFGRVLVRMGELDGETNRVAEAREVVDAIDVDRMPSELHPRYRALLKQLEQHASDAPEGRGGSG